MMHQNFSKSSLLTHDCKDVSPKISLRYTHEKVIVHDCIMEAGVKIVYMVGMITILISPFCGI